MGVWNLENLNFKFLKLKLWNSLVTTASQFSLDLPRLRVPVNVSILCKINDCVQQKNLHYA